MAHRARKPATAARKPWMGRTRAPVQTWARGRAVDTRRSMKRATAGEVKFHDVDVDDATIAAGGTIVASSLVQIAQGVGESQRIGRRCTITSLGLRYRIVSAATAGASLLGSDVVRVLVYLDKQANGAAAAVTDILESAEFHSFNNLANKDRFRTLHDKVYALNAQAGAGDGTTNDAAGVNEYAEFYTKMNVVIEYNSTAGAVSEIRSNNIGILLLSASGLYTFDSKVRIRFTG